MYQIFLKPIVITLVLLGGAFVAMGLCVAMVRRRRRLLKEAGYRSPVQEKLLRPPGYSNGERVESLRFDLIEAIGQSAIGGAGTAFLGVLAARCFWNLARIDWTHVSGNSGLITVISLAHLAAFGLALGYAWYQIRRFLRLESETANWRLGTRGEQFVGEALSDPQIIAVGYRAYHDIPGDADWNIDHVVVGPGGVYVIETKARTKRPGNGEQAKHVVHYDGQSLQFPDWNDRKTIEQVNANAEWLRRWLGDHVSKDLAFHRLVVIPGWWVETKGRYDVKVMNTRYLKGYLLKEPRLFPPETLNPVLSKLDERCRTVEV